MDLDKHWENDNPCDGCYSVFCYECWTGGEAGAAIGYARCYEGCSNEYCCSCAWEAETGHRPLFDEDGRFVGRLECPDCKCNMKFAND